MYKSINSTEENNSLPVPVYMSFKFFNVVTKYMLQYKVSRWISILFLIYPYTNSVVIKVSYNSTTTLTAGWNNELATIFIVGW
jgi:hypothetical protein